MKILNHFLAYYDRKIPCKQMRFSCFFVLFYLLGHLTVSPFTEERTENSKKSANVYMLYQQNFAYDGGVCKEKEWLLYFTIFNSSSLHLRALIFTRREKLQKGKKNKRLQTIWTFPAKTNKNISLIFKGRLLWWDQSHKFSYTCRLWINKYISWPSPSPII